MIISLSEHQLLVFWVQLLMLLLAARALGVGARRLGLPPVVGELLAGVLVGPSVLGKLWPDGFEWLFPVDAAQSAALLAVGWIGVVLLLLVTGFETDFGLIARLGRAAMLVAAGSLLVPFAFGIGLGSVLPERFVGVEDDRVVFALFMATALSISSLPVIAKILSELGLLRRNFGQITLAAGMANDVVGWILLGVIAGIAATGAFEVGQLAVTLAGMAVFLLLAFTVGQRVADVLLRRALRDTGSGSSLAVSLLVALAFAVITQALHVEAVLGAFIAGIVLGRSRFQHERVHAQIESMTAAFFAPIFFATAGLRVDLAALGDPTVLVWAIVVIVVATAAKFVGAIAGAGAARLPRREGLALGAGLNARGALEIIIATIGLSLGVLNDAAYTVVVLMALATTVMAGPLLRLSVRNWPGTAEERARLEREEALERNIVVRQRRVLLPSRGGPGSIVAAQVMHFAWPDEVGVTVLTVGEGDESLDPIVNVLHGREVELHRSPNPVAGALDRILDESRLGYGAVGLGVADVRRTDRLLSPVVEGLINESPLPVVLVRAARNLESRLPQAFTRAFVPVSGGQASRAAQEIAFNISTQLGTDIVLSHVVTQRSEVPVLGVGLPGGDRRMGSEDGVAERLLRQAVDLAREMGVDTKSHVVRGRSSPGDEIVQAAREADADLVVLGARPRRMEGRPYLGANVERVLEDCDATVVVVVVPEPVE